MSILLEIIIHWNNLLCTHTISFLHEIILIHPTLYLHFLEIILYWNIPNAYFLCNQIISILLEIISHWNYLLCTHNILSLYLYSKKMKYSKCAYFLSNKQCPSSYHTVAILLEIIIHWNILLFTHTISFLHWKYTHDFISLLFCVCCGGGGSFFYLSILGTLPFRPWNLEFFMSFYTKLGKKNTNESINQGP